MKNAQNFNSSCIFLNQFLFRLLKGNVLEMKFSFYAMASLGKQQTLSKQLHQIYAIWGSKWVKAKTKYLYTEIASVLLMNGQLYIVICILHSAFYILRVCNWGVRGNMDWPSQKYVNSQSLR